jgi:hypothetical protein
MADEHAKPEAITQCLLVTDDNNADDELYIRDFYPLGMDALLENVDPKGFSIPVNEPVFSHDERREGVREEVLKGEMPLPHRTENDERQGQPQEITPHQAKPEGERRARRGFARGERRARRARCVVRYRKK